MIEKKRILIFGPDGAIGGVRTHVDKLLRVLEPFTKDVKVTSGSSVIRTFKDRKIFKPEIVIYNLSVNRNKIIRDIVSRTILSIKKTHHFLHLHGGNFEDVFLLKFPIFKYILRYHFKRFDQIFCLTQDQFSYVQQLVGKRDIVKKIYNYVEIPDEKRLVKNYDTIKLLYIGRLHRLKGIVNAVEAVKKIKCNNLKFYIIGDGEVKNKIKNIGDSRIAYLGKLIGTEREKYLAEAHAFIFPSSWPEGLPYALLEAISFGLAIISTDVGAVKEILYDGQNGILIESGKAREIKKAIEKLISNPRMIEKMGFESRRICERKFSIDNLKELYFDLFKDFEV